MKKIMLFFVVFVLLFIFVGCKDKNDDSGEIEVKIYDFAGEEVFKEKISFEKDDTLEGLLKEHKTIKMKGEESTFGFFIVELMGISANNHGNAFWNVKVNGEDSLVGVRDIRLVDGDVIEFHLISWQ
jgi:hypothetical protein